MVLLSGAIVGVSYVTPELHFRFGIILNAIYGMHQPNMNLKT
jgi:hypothetical protein